MKKPLVLVLSIMFVVGAFTPAYAAVEALASLEGSQIILGGDANVKSTCKMNYDTNDNVDDNNCYLEQKVRLTVRGKIGDAEVRTRLTTGQNQWNDAANKWNNAANTGNIAVDEAYLHIPVAGFVIDAGRQKADFGTGFYQLDAAKDRFKVSAQVGDVTVGAYTDKISEDLQSDVPQREGFLNNDVDDYGIFAIYKAGSMEGGALVVFRNDDTVDNNNGTDATVYVNTITAGLRVRGELSMKTGDFNYALNGSDCVTGTCEEDTQLGGFISVDKRIDAITVGGLFVFTNSGFVADDSGTTYDPAAQGALGGVRAGNFQHTLLGGLVVNYQATPDLSVGGKAFYAHYDEYPDNNTDSSSSVELDAVLRYRIFKRVEYVVDFGYLFPKDFSPTDDKIFSIISQFKINFN